MINLQQGLNDIYLTLDEFSTNSGSNYIFEFENTGKIIRFTADDISFYPERYNQFEIMINSGNTDLLQGVLNIDISGLWDYKVYEYNGEITEDIIENSNYKTLNAVEVGKMRVRLREDDKIYKENDLNKKIYKK